MKIKSILALLLAFCMIFSVVGCGKVIETTSEIIVGGEGTTTVIEGEEGYYEGAEGATGTTSDNASSTGSDETSSSGKTSSAGKTSSSGGSKNNSGKITVTLSKWSASFEPEKSNPKYASWKKKVDAIEKKYNCELAFKHVVSFNEYWTAVNSANAAGIKYADITMLGSADVFPKSMRNGHLHALDDYIDLSDLAWDQNALKQTEYEGKHYILFANDIFNGNMLGLGFNRAVLDKFGQKYPSEYVKEGKWNTDTFLTLAKACTGKIDGIDYIGFSQSKAEVAVWGKIFGGEHIHKRNGKYIYEPDAKYIAGIQFAYDLVNTHKQTGGDRTNSAMWITTCWFAGIKNSIPEEDAGWTYLPKGPGESNYYCDFDSVECWAIPSVVKNPDVIAKILVDYAYPEKGRDNVENNLKSQFYDEESYNTAYAAAKQAQKTAQLTPRYNYIKQKIGWNWHGIDKKQSPQAFFAEVKAEAQACLDETWDQ